MREKESKVSAGRLDMVVVFMCVIKKVVENKKEKKRQRKGGRVVFFWLQIFLPPVTKIDSMRSPSIQRSSMATRGEVNEWARFYFVQ